MCTTILGLRRFKVMRFSFFFFYFQPPEGNPTSQFVEVRRLCIGIKEDTTGAYKDSTSGKLLTTSLTLWLPHPSSVRLGDGDV